VSLFFGQRERRGPFPEPPIPPPLRSMTFARVSLAQTEASLQKVAVWAAVDLIASLGSLLPIDVFEGTGAARRELPTPKILEDPSGEGYGTADWIYQYLMSLLLRGNTNGRVGDRDRLGNPTQIVLYHPDDVQGWRDDESGLPKWRVCGKDVPADEMWHQRAYTIPGRLLGLSPVRHHATTIGLGIAAGAVRPAVVRGRRAPLGAADERAGADSGPGQDREGTVHGRAARHTGTGGAGAGLEVPGDPGRSGRVAVPGDAEVHGCGVRADLRTGTCRRSSATRPAAR
jgi:phage portal protein BeeE